MLYHQIFESSKYSKTEYFKKQTISVLIDFQNTQYLSIYLSTNETTIPKHAQYENAMSN